MADTKGNSKSSTHATSPPQSPHSTLSAESEPITPQHTSKSQGATMISNREAATTLSPMAKLDPSIISSKLQEPSPETTQSSPLSRTNHLKAKQDETSKVKNSLSATAPAFTPPVIVAKTPVYEKSAADVSTRALSNEDRPGTNEISILDRISATAKQIWVSAPNTSTANHNNNQGPFKMQNSKPQNPTTTPTRVPAPKPTILSGSKIKLLQATPEWLSKSPTERLALNPSCAFANCPDMRFHRPNSTASACELYSWAQMVENSMIAASTDSLHKATEIESQAQTIRMMQADIKNLNTVLSWNAPVHVAEFRALVSQLRASIEAGQKEMYNALAGQLVTSILAGQQGMHEPLVSQLHADILAGLKEVSDPLVVKLLERIRRLEGFETERCVSNIGSLSSRVKELYEESVGGKAEVGILKAKLNADLKLLEEKDQEIASLKESLSKERMTFDRQLETKGHALKQSQKEGSRYREKLKKDIEALEKRLAAVSAEKALSHQTMDRGDQVDGVSGTIEAIRPSSDVLSASAQQTSDEGSPESNKKRGNKKNVTSSTRRSNSNDSTSETFAVQHPQSQPTLPDGFH